MSRQSKPLATMPNFIPDEEARESIDKMPGASGWAVLKKGAIAINTGEDQAIRECHTDTGRADHAPNSS